MIVYCGLRHFYIHYFAPDQPNYFHILTYKKEIWDFSPELKQYGFNKKGKTDAVYDFEKPVITTPIELEDFQSFAREWHDFSRQYTEDLEPEYPHSWYLQFHHLPILDQFISDFTAKLGKKQWEGIWGAAPSKILAKLAAHSLPKGAGFIRPEQAAQFLEQTPISRLPLPELEKLNKLGLKTLGELGKVPLTELIFQFGTRAKILQQLGQGEDLCPFRAQAASQLQWELDCTVLDGFLRPLTPSELKPYLKRGLQDLSLTLKEKRKNTSLLKLEAVTATQISWERKRLFKEPTNDFAVLKRAALALIPQEPLAQIRLAAAKLQTAEAVQLDMGLQPPSAKPVPQQLPAQVGIDLPRRERLLIMWEEQLYHE